MRKSLAIGYVKADFAAVGTQLAIEILGERKQATVIPESPYDPENQRSARMNLTSIIASRTGPGTRCRAPFYLSPGRAT